MGRRGYPAEFRQRVLDLVAAGRGVEDVARDLGISDQTIYSWRHQDRIDQSTVPVFPGLTAAQRAVPAWQGRIPWTSAGSTLMSWVIPMCLHQKLQHSR
jgi:transposase